MGPCAASAAKNFPAEEMADDIIVLWHGPLAFLCLTDHETQNNKIKSWAISNNKPLSASASDKTACKGMHVQKIYSFLHYLTLYSSVINTIELYIGGYK